MTDHDATTEIKGYQERQPELALTFAQAKFLYENDAATRFHSTTFSTWELLDYEYEMYRQTLTTSQFELFESGWKERQQKTKEAIASSDGQEAEWPLRYFGDLLAWKRDHFWPEIKQVPMFRVIWSGFEPDKSTLLKASYRQYLDEVIAARVARHFRDYRRFAPERLKAVEVENGLLRIDPHYGPFYRQADDAVRAVFDFLRRQIETWNEESFQEVSQVFQKWADEEREIFARQPVQYPTAVLPDRRTSGQKLVDGLLNLLLVELDEMPG